MKKKQKEDIIGWIQEQQRKLAAGLIVEMKNTNSTKMRVDSEIASGKDRFFIETKISKNAKKIIDIR